MHNSTDNNQPLLHLEDIYKQYGSKVVLDDIDLRVNRGEFCVVVGPSGCGKSTMLRLILGQEQQTKGTLNFMDKPIGPPDTDRGIVYQRYSLYPHLTVLDNIILGKKLQSDYSKNKDIIIQEAHEFLERARLKGHANKYPHELSGGMQQRVAIIQALIMRPKILLMDEPFGALDPETREEMQLFILEMWEQNNMTIFFVTHDLEEAVFLGTRLIVLSQYYTDGRGKSATRGARIVADHQLKQKALSTHVKHSSEFKQLLTDIRNEGFNPDILQHAGNFNLKHPDSFQTLSQLEKKNLE